MNSRTPGPALRPFVSCLWHAHSQVAGTPTRELVLPTGLAHLVVRLSERPLRVYAGVAAPESRTLSHAVLGGPRSAYYVRDISHATESVGAMLRPGAAARLFGVEAHELAESHTALPELWGTAADALRDRLRNAGSAEDKLRLFEQALTERLRARLRASSAILHPAVAHALKRFAQGVSVDAVVREVGYSHRHFLTQFRSQVGLSPKRFAQVERFQRALALTQASPSLSLAAVATHAGYSDQAHFSREFKSFAGVSPARYVQLAPEGGNHVPIQE